MTLTLTIRNAAALENGMPIEFVLHRRGAIVGRADTCDWSLPDPQRHISSRHFEIRYHDDGYWLQDTSTNGTFVNDSTDPLQGEHRIEQGDIILIGNYEIGAELSGSEAESGEGAESEPESWNGWADSAAPAASSAGDEWGEPQDPPTVGAGWKSTEPGAGQPSQYSIAGPATPPPSRGFEWGERRPVAEEVPSTDGWAPTHDAPDIPDGASVWEGPQAAPDTSSGWSSAAADRPQAAGPADIWGQIAEDNVVDWARGGFGSPAPPPPADPLGLEEDNSINSMPLRSPVSPEEVVTAPTAPPRRKAKAKEAPALGPAPDADAERMIAQFLAASGIKIENLRGPRTDAIARAGGLLRRLVAGLVVLVEARARAKSQMGAEATRLELDGNNPIKFARSPDQVLALLLSPPERGFMDSERAVEDAFFDLQSHQMATLKAMQGALRATLERFAPEAIRARAETKGFLESILPAARDATLWRAYEREFSGVARGSDEAFMDVFAKEFRKAYEEQSRTAGQLPPC